ncbi:hypothetical protein SAMN02744102_01857 [Paenibacillus barengoltzii]|nr:hypothetical protein SAMN02744102_01857 [Paenibacillus barengoltzii]
MGGKHQKLGMVGKQSMSLEKVEEIDLRRKFCQVVDKVIHSLLAFFVKIG